MDSRNSKKTLLSEIERLKEKLEAVYNAGHEGIGYVGRANYPEREMEAIRNLDIAMYGPEENAT